MKEQLILATELSIRELLTFFKEKRKQNWLILWVLTVVNNPLDTLYEHHADCKIQGYLITYTSCWNLLNYFKLSLKVNRHRLSTSLKIIIPHSIIRAGLFDKEAAVIPGLWASLYVFEV